MINHMILQGRLVAEPELRTTQSGITVCSFRVAWSEKYKETETKLFLSCTAWRGMGEMVARYFTKGREIAVEGKLSTRDWTDKEGNNRQSVEMTVDRVHFCGPKPEDTALGTGYTSGYTPAPSAPVNISAGDFTELEDDGELPF